jgi:biopolymer transport protein ExbD
VNFRSTPDDEPELNLIPLIDVLLMTLIFLIVTTSFTTESQLRVRLPEAAADAPAEKPTVRIAIDARGQYFIDGQQLLNTGTETLRAALARAVEREKEPLIVIQADAKTPHEAVVRVMDVARRLGLSQLTFATQQPAPGSPTP